MEQVAGYIFSETITFPQKTKILGNNNGNTVFEAVLQDADKVNRNKRVYTSQVLHDGLKHPYVLERKATKSWYGEAGRIAIHSSNVMSKFS